MRCVDQHMAFRCLAGHFAAWSNRLSSFGSSVKVKQFYKGITRKVQKSRVCIRWDLLYASVVSCMWKRGDRTAFAWGGRGFPRWDDPRCSFSIGVRVHGAGAPSKQGRWGAKEPAGGKPVWLQSGAGHAGKKWGDNLPFHVGIIQSLISLQVLVFRCEHRNVGAASPMSFEEASQAFGLLKMLL